MPVQDVHLHDQPVFADEDALRDLAAQRAVFEGQPLLAPHGRVAAQADALGRAHLFQNIRDFLPALVHAQRQKFGDQIVAVAVDDERGQVVRLGKDAAIAVGLRAEQRFAQGKGGADALFERRVLLFRLAAQKDAH